MISLFWLSAVGLLLLASVFVVLPLWWSVKRTSEGALARAEGNLQLHEERLQELAQALSAGEITKAEYSGQVEDQSLVLLEDAGPLLAAGDAGQRNQGAARGSKGVFAMGGLPSFGEHLLVQRRRVVTRRPHRAHFYRKPAAEPGYA